MRGNKVVVGVFTYIDDTIKAVKKVQSDKLEYRVYSPVPHHELMEVIDPTPSAVRRFTLLGGITGLTCGFALAIWCSMDYPLRVSAKDVVSPPGFFVIGYEWTILFGGLFTLFAMLFLCRLPDVLRKVGFDPRFTQDKFGVAVGCDKNAVETVKAALVDAGADEVEVRDAL